MNKNTTEIVREMKNNKLMNEELLTNIIMQ